MCPAKISLKGSDIKEFSYKQKLRKFAKNTPALKDILKEIFQIKKKGITDVRSEMSEGKMAKEW